MKGYLEIAYKTVLYVSYGLLIGFSPIIEVYVQDSGNVYAKAFYFIGHLCLIWVSLLLLEHWMFTPNFERILRDSLKLNEDLINQLDAMNHENRNLRGQVKELVSENTAKSESTKVPKKRIRKLSV